MSFSTNDKELIVTPPGSAIENEGLNEIYAN